MIVSAPLFEPDKSPFNTGASDVVLNCLPTADGVGPMYSMMVQSEALPGPCIGATYVRDADGDTAFIAGTASNLYRLDTSTSPYSWLEISKSTDAYNVPEGDKWQFDVFGDTLIATNAGDYPQQYDITAGGDFSDLTTAFKARYVRSVGDFLMFAYLDGEPDVLRWSGLNDATYWTNGLRGADQQVIPTGREIMGIIGDQRGALVVLRDAMHLMPYAPGSGYTFTRSEVNTKRGAVSPHSIVQIGQDQFVYLSEDGFFAGVDGKAIGAERVDRWFLDDLDRTYLHDVRGMADPMNKIVWWRYRTNTGSSRLIGYDWQLDRWCQSDLDLSEAASAAVPALSWDGLDTIFATIDDFDIPFDSPILKGGKPVFVGFDGQNRIGFYGGAPLQATIETAWIEPEPGSRTFLNGGRVIGDMPTHTVASGVKDYHGDDVEWRDAVSPSPRSGILPLRANGRLHKQRIIIPDGVAWTALNGIDLNFAEAGQL